MLRNWKKLLVVMHKNYELQFGCNLDFSGSATLAVQVIELSIYLIKKYITKSTYSMNPLNKNVKIAITWPLKVNECI